ncbi:valyl-tRNA synthetase [Spinellus fusiger]|nr:valyl-tRNA synthetase [Spinellus fusiger]
MATPTQETRVPPAAPPVEELSPEAAAKKAKNEAKNEEKRLAKLAKFAAKQAKLDEQKSQATEAEPSEKKKKKAAKAAPAPVFVDKTPKGEKKDMSEPMASAYDPRAVESAWYEWWLKEKFFEPELTPEGEIKPEGLFVVPSPPPNVTGSLHIGHALTVAIQDTLIRWNRMLGKTVLFNPGTDHAGISCQSVVEKKLWKEEKKTRHDLGREAFVEEIWKWKEKFGGRIHEQFYRLGASYDWSRVAFTMDPKLSNAVMENFVRLHRDGTIYRANRLVNWCVHLNTALSNLEVDNKELPGRTLMSVAGYDASEQFEFGILNEFAYEVEDSNERIVVATTRIETMLGDSAIAVHSKDERYTHLHGKYVKHPFLSRRIPIITDDLAVDMAFGTGAVKMTPAHDFNDYEVGKRHQLEFINVLNDDGTMNEAAGPYKGMKRFHVRTKIVDDLKALGLFVGIKENPMSVPVCSKSGDIIEPLMKPQWWVSCKAMAQEAMQAVTDGQLKIAPKVSEADWFRWLGNMQDWCISRQLWWGHRVPAYFVRVEGVEGEENDNHYWVSGKTEALARVEAEARFPGKTFALEQDPDVLDTWFSSALWPFSIMGWPENTDDMKKFYPSSLLETGWDILFFWVARMVMLGIKLTGQVPFKEVFCHAMIRDAHGRKMSKTLGNVIDPVDVIEGISLEGLHQKLLEGNLDAKEVAKAKAGQKSDFPKGIPECGTDALRFALCAYTTGGRDINLDILRVEGYRKFCNKLWNATRFAMMKLGSDFTPNVDASLTGHESLNDKWILHKLNIAAVDTNKFLTERNFMGATNAIYQFWLYELCDVYIEVIKPVCDSDSTDATAVLAKRTAQNTLYTCLEAGLKLLHPFTPFVTEELYQRLGRRPEDTVQSITKARYPVENKSYENVEVEKDFDAVFDIVKALRSLAVTLNKKKEGEAFVQAHDTKLAVLLEQEHVSVLTLCKGIKELKTVEGQSQVPEDCESVQLPNSKATLWLRK